MGLLGAMETRAHTVSRLRGDLRSLCERSPSPASWLIAARLEAQLAGGSHRVQVCCYFMLLLHNEPLGRTLKRHACASWET